MKSLFLKITNTFFRVFVNLWFLLFVFWILVLYAIKDSSEILGAGDYIIVMLVCVIGIMLSIKFWVDNEFV